MYQLLDVPGGVREYSFPMSMKASALKDHDIHYYVKVGVGRELSGAAMGGYGLRAKQLRQYVTHLHLMSQL